MSGEEAPKQNGGDISPQIGLPRKRNPDNAACREARSRRQSKSIIDVLGIVGDQLDAGAVGTERNLADASKVEKFFRYKMNHKDRGIFVIFNHKKFAVERATDRDGTDVDKENLFNTARELGFTVFTHDNLTVKNLMKAIDQYARIDYTDCDCFACAILTHGEAGDLLYAYDGKYSLRELLNPFQQTATLIGKPKLFFIQACRGSNLDHGIKLKDQVDAIGFNGLQTNECTSIPVEADVLIGYSTIEGFYAWRNGEDGSWFIQALCFCLKEYGEKMELMQIMTRVNRMVAYDFESNVSHPLYDKKKQMPSVVTRLTGDVYFHSQGSHADCESVDHLRLPRPLDRKRNQKEGQSMFLKKQALKAKLELTKLSRAKAEIKMKEQGLLEKLLELEFESL